MVTGTVHTGIAANGERLVVTPSGYEARIRTIHAQDRPAGHARAGERCALNRAGRDIESGAIARGDWIVDRALHAPTDRIDVRLSVLPGEERALRHWTPVHAHLAASHSTARVAVLGAGSIGPGESGRVQIVLDHPRFAGRLINAMGMRASESPARSKLASWRHSARNSKAGRVWFDWLPIHGLETPDVFRVIRDAGQSPHWAYAAGMSRLSCSFCILASRSDLRRAAELRPALYRQYVDLERRIGHTLSPTRVPLPTLTGVPVEPTARARRHHDARHAELRGDPFAAS